MPLHLQLLEDFRWANPRLYEGTQKTCPAVNWIGYFSGAGWERQLLWPWEDRKVPMNSDLHDSVVKSNTYCTVSVISQEIGTSICHPSYHGFQADTVLLRKEIIKLNFIFTPSNTLNFTSSPSHSSPLSLYRTAISYHILKYCLGLIEFSRVFFFLKEPFFQHPWRIHKEFKNQCCYKDPSPVVRTTAFENYDLKAGRMHISSWGLNNIS